VAGKILILIFLIHVVKKMLYKITRVIEDLQKAVKEKDEKKIAEFQKVSIA